MRISILKVHLFTKAVRHKKLPRLHRVLLECGLEQYTLFYLGGVNLYHYTQVICVVNGKGRLQPGEQPSLHRRGVSVASVDGPWSLTMGKEGKILLVGLCPVKDSCEEGN